MRKVIFYTLFVTVAIIAIILPVLGNFHFRVAYSAFQERRWEAAAEELALASQWEPLNAKYYQLRAEAFINLGRYDNAMAMYERAVQLKRDFAPYYSQLGWLYWLQGDLEQATVHFQKAVEMDPIEAWQGGLHTDLALAYIAKGRIAEAIPLLKKSIELDPDMKLAPVTVWVPVQGVDGKFDVVIDPIYFASVNVESVSGPLEERILAHLGKTDYTARLFTLDYAPLTPSATISLNQILDAIKADYLIAQANNNLEAPRLLATIAEAARVAGLNTCAEQAYMLFQDNFPTSAYGFRELGTFYRKQGRLAEAQTTFERAVKIRPDDPDSWSALAEVYLNRELQNSARLALDTLYRLSPLYPRLNELQAQLYQQQGKLAEATDNLRKSLVITESIPNRINLASLYYQLDRQQQASEQCMLAADALRRTVSRPLDPQLWDVSVCLAQSNLRIKDLANLNICKSTNEQICNVVLGHIHRARGEFEQALVSYDEADNNRPDDGSSDFFLGQTYEALGRFSEAEAKYKQAASLNPLESLPLLSLGRLQWGQGRKDAAIQSFSAAVLATPGWGETHTALGNGLLVMGDTQAASMNYRLAQIADKDLREGEIYDFAAHLADAKIQSPSPDYVKNDYFTIDSLDGNSDGKWQRVLFMHPVSNVSYTLTVPDSATLTFNLAISPDSWAQTGDGVNFFVNIQSEQGAQQILSTYIDPKHNTADRRWSPFTLDLDAYAGQTITIMLMTNCGPVGDCQFDWAGWGEPVILLTK